MATPPSSTVSDFLVAPPAGRSAWRGIGILTMFRSRWHGRPAHDSDLTGDTPVLRRSPHGIGFRHGLVALIATLFAFNPAHSQPAPAAPAPAIVAQVGSVAITYDALQVVAAQNGYDLTKSSDRDLALRDAVNQELLAVEARRRGYDQDPEIQRYVRAQSIQRLLRATVDAPASAAAARPSAAPDQAALRAYYDQNLAEFTRPAVAQAQVLALLRRANDTQFPARLAELQQALAKPADSDFGALVKRYSDDPGVQSGGGRTPWLVQGESNKQFPAALIDAVFAAPDDKAIVGPISHNDWVYFVRRIEKRDAIITPFEQAQPAIARQLARRQRLDAYDAFVKGLADTATVQTWPERVAEAVTAETKAGGPPTGPVRPRP